jgi:hypothetical protein
MNTYSLRQKRHMSPLLSFMSLARSPEIGGKGHMALFDLREFEADGIPSPRQIDVERFYRL